MSSTVKVKMAFIIIAMSFLVLALIVVIYLGYKEQKYVTDFKIPAQYSLVKYDDDNFVIMDSARTKFLVYWDNETHSMENKMWDLKGSEITVKRHLIQFLNEKLKEENKIKIENKLKNSH
jgi:hypothetical protein